MESEHFEFDQSKPSGTAADGDAAHGSDEVHYVVTEETPTMRSVSMLTRPQPQNGPSVEGAKRFGTYDISLSHEQVKFGLSKPAKGLKGLSRESFGIKKEWSGTVSWDVRKEELELVPTNFPLERTHREINEDAGVVANRISDALRSLSIETEFDSKKAKAKCTTTDCVNFRIRLYAGGEYGEPVVVEVQRRCGSASSFMRSCRAILSAAEGMGLEGDLTLKSKMIPPSMKMPITQMKCIQSVVPREDEIRNEARTSLDCAMEMIRSNRHDLTLLGLENLTYLTDPIKTSPIASLHIAKDVIIGEDTNDIREEIRVLTERDSFIPEFDQGGAPPSHIEHLRHLALRVFSSALSLCSKDGCLTNAIKEQRWFGECLIPSLIDEVNRAPDFANNAYEASSCLYSLISCSDLALEVFIENRGLHAMELAYEFGCLRHELLAEESGRCLEVVNSNRAAR